MIRYVKGEEKNLPPAKSKGAYPQGRDHNKEEQGHHKIQGANS